MLSVKPLESAKNAHDYYMQAIEYYQSDANAMQWLGAGKQYLKLGDEIDGNLLLNLLQGILPNGQKLQNPQGEHRPGFDMTFSAPKSVSLLVGLGAAPELLKFHDAAVEHAIAKIETEFAQTRVRSNGEIIYKNTGNLLVASFRQPSSRANDPALHTHCVTLNMTFLDGKARSLASDKSRTFGVVEQIQNHQRYCGLLYRQHLANSLKEAGFQLRLTGDGLFEIDGIPDVVLSEFSRRREDIERLMEEKGWAGAKSASAATLITRNGKEEHDMDTLQADWHARAKALDFDAQAFMQQRGDRFMPDSRLSIIREKLGSFINRIKGHVLVTESDLAKACVSVAVETLSQRVSVFTERALLAESLKHSLVHEKAISQETIKAAIHQEKEAQNLYAAQCIKTKQIHLTTPWLLSMEVETIARIESNKEAIIPIARHHEVIAFQKSRASHRQNPMTASQQQAMATVLTTKDRFLAIQGYAGVAKTTMLAEARLLIEDKGYQMRGIAVASSAANELQTKAGISSDVFPTVYQELKNAKTGSLNKTVFIVDESSMLSSPQGHELLKHIERTQSRLILVGDKAQLPSVNNGRIFGLIQDYGIETTLMDDIVRQQNLVLKEAVVHATQGQIQDAMQKLDIQELNTHEARIQWIANHWLALSKKERDDTLLFAPTHSDRESITTLLRNGLKKEGALKGTELMQTTLKSKPIEAVQQRFIAYYQKGDVVRFNQDFKKHGVERNQYYSVGTISPQHRRDNVLPLINDKGTNVNFSLKSLPQYKTHTAPFERVLEIYQTKPLALQSGDKVMWTRNFKADGIRNGEMLTMQAIQQSSVIVTTKDDQSITLQNSHPALKHLDYSYVLTNYKVQGKDAPYGIGLMESYHRFGATCKNFYVQISRAIHGMTLVTDDKTQLVEAIQRNHDEKQAALDMISSRQLMAHVRRFQEHSNLSFQPVIDKKKTFDVDEQAKRVAPTVSELRFEKSATLKEPVHIKELER